METDKEILENAPEESISEVDLLKSQLAEMTDKYIRAVAEMENVRRRAVIDTESALRARAISVAENFLPIVDAINAALAHDPDNVGLRALVNATDAALEKMGITKIDTVGKPLNPNVHNAINTTPATDKFPADIIASEFQSGYIMSDAILRPAMVIVAK